MPENLHCIRYRRATDTARVSGLDVIQLESFNDGCRGAGSRMPAENLRR